MEAWKTILQNNIKNTRKSVTVPLKKMYSPTLMLLWLEHSFCNTIKGYFKEHINIKGQHCHLIAPGSVTVFVKFIMVFLFSSRFPAGFLVPPTVQEHPCRWICYTSLPQGVSGYMCVVVCAWMVPCNSLESYLGGIFSPYSGTHCDLDLNMTTLGMHCNILYIINMTFIGTFMMVFLFLS